MATVHSSTHSLERNETQYSAKATIEVTDRGRFRCSVTLREQTDGPSKIVYESSKAVKGISEAEHRMQEMVEDCIERAEKIEHAKEYKFNVGMY